MAPIVRKLVMLLGGTSQHPTVVRQFTRRSLSGIGEVIRALTMLFSRLPLRCLGAVATIKRAVPGKAPSIDPFIRSNRATRFLLQNIILVGYRPY